LPLLIWFQAIYFISHAKTGLSAMELGRHLGVRHPTGLPKSLFSPFFQAAPGPQGKA
jgi:hypothetical protein